MDQTNRTRDEWLALRCQLGEPGAFEDLLAVMERPLFYYAAKLLGGEERALDVLQEVWLRVFRNIGRLKDPASLRPWLYRIVHGLAVDSIRAEPWEDPQAEFVDESVEPGFTAEDADAIHGALGELEWKHREVLTLHFLEDFSISEIAAIAGCPEGTVKSRMYHAKKAMKEILKRGGYGT